MRALILDAAARDRIAVLKTYADAHRIDRRRMARIVELVEAPVGDNPRHVTNVQHGYRCVYSVEEYPIGWCRHLSVSVDAPEKLPSPEAVSTLLKEFGFGDLIIEALWRLSWAPGRQSKAMVWIESGHAVNVVEPL